ncbi:uncharacterized protein F4807DRAFT_190026 [Annulohypoxylon truncatum]|uniref:uncharacterized protein n=1 Tax=Annulohypoxylon truncatum TaxID=327061 RepID=UPI0020084C8E|nr:uncharacterized protein F4807DRAFT_190026 [Annulohypoxylon truncatum]KAI1207178.1 hypothetical protein F4807DRAFT_190026 [Annulohypoxylon truncatum]
MKSVAIAAALLASTAVAQPHGHHRHNHPKRDLVVEWETVWETATVIIDDDSTSTIAPASTGTPAQFFQPDTSSSSSSSSAAPVVQTPTVQAQPSTPSTLVSIAQATTYSTSSQAPTSTYATPTQQTTAAPVTPSSSSTYSAAAPTSSASSGGSTGSDGIPYNQKFSGDITYYNAALGACGYEDTGKDDTTNIVAIPKAFWDSISTATSYGLNEPAHPLCDKTITITSSDGKTTTATIRDRCDGCAGHAIDVTPHTFTDLFGSLTGGRLEGSWVINE